MSQSTLGQRVLREHRRLVLPLAIALLVNIVVYAVVVRPLSDRVANIAQRDASADQSLNAARKEHAAATGMLTGKDKASQELARFYKDVLPRDFAAARRLTHTRVPKIAKQFNVDFYSSTVPSATRARDGHGMTGIRPRTGKLADALYRQSRTGGTLPRRAGIHSPARGIAGIRGHRRRVAFDGGHGWRTAPADVAALHLLPGGG